MNERGTNAERDPTGQNVTIERSIPGGDGLARCEDGRIVFVPGAFAGDIVKLVTTTLHTGFVRATRWQLLQPSADRREAPCPIADRCGGCDWMQLSDEAQGRAKLELVRDALTRVGGIDPLPPLQLTRRDPLGYRSRLRLRVGTDGGVGLLAKGTHQLVELQSCAVASKELNDALRSLAPLFDANSPKPVSSLSSELILGACHAIEQVEVRTLGARPELLVYPRATTGRKPGRAGARATVPTIPEQMIPEQWLRAAAATFQVQLAGVKATAAATQRVSLPVSGQVAATTLHVSPEAFTQVNWQINSALTGDLVAGALERGLSSFLDLYCGVGNFALPLLAAGLRGKAVESNGAAVACATEAAIVQQLDGTFVREDAGRFMRKLRQTGERFDLVLVDPPRAGIKPLVEDVAALASEWIFYCACDPVSFARDAKQFAKLGFETVQLHAYDMFPQTHHVELTAWLRKPPAQ